MGDKSVRNREEKKKKADKKVSNTVTSSVPTTAKKSK